MPDNPWSAVRNILCIRLDSLGDVLMMTPAIRALRENRPGVRITLLTSPEGARIARLVPEIDEVIPHASVWMKHTPARASAEEELALIGMLRARAFDAAVIFTTFSQSPLPAAYLCHLADVPKRLAHCRENVYQLLTDWVPEPEPARGVRHEVERQLALVRSVGATTVDDRLSLAAPSIASLAVELRLRRMNLARSERWFVVHPGATAESRRYPVTMFAQAVKRLGELGFSAVVTGGPTETDLADALVAEAGECAQSLAGRLTLEELVALVKRAPLLLTNNTGPAHVAAAVQTPVVDLYALTNPQHTPWKVASRVLSHDVPCKNCFKSVCPEKHHECLRGVAPERVVAAVLDLWRETAARRSRGTSGESRTSPASDDLPAVVG